MLWLILWFVLILLVSFYGKPRFLGFWGTLILSLLITPILVFLVLLILDKVSPLSPAIKKEVD